MLGNVPGEGLGDVTSEGVGTERACARAHTQVNPPCWSSPLLSMPPALPSPASDGLIPKDSAATKSKMCQAERLLWLQQCHLVACPPQTSQCPHSRPSTCRAWAGQGPRVHKELRLFPALLGRLISQLLGKALSSTSLNKSLLLQTDSYFSPSVQRCLLK